VWRRTQVAVKAMVFPANMSGKEKREKMAIMETAISSSLSHPNVVQTYTYAVRPVRGEISLQQQVRGRRSAGGVPGAYSWSSRQVFVVEAQTAGVYELLPHVGGSWEGMGCSAVCLVRWVP
jgi:hypothetical protein